MNKHLLAPFGLLLLALPLHAQRVRCGTPEPVMFPSDAAPSDCGYWDNSPEPEYEPSFYYDIPVVVHVIQNSSGEGFLSAQTVQDQIDVLNEDFQALPGSLGAPGTDARIRFHLANTDPNGQPTSGITYTTNNSWYDDSGNYWDALAWDTRDYLNIYTNAPPCCYGYVSGFASAGGLVGDKKDRVVLWWEAVGKQPTAGWPGNMGRTGTHEVGHYLGLYHTFCGGCGSAQNCYETGDLICDTNGQQSSTWGCPSSPSSCGNADPFHNYMDYTDDLCMWEFTPEQVKRMRCTLQHWRPDLALSSPASETPLLGVPPNPNVLLPGQSSAPVLGATWDPLIDHTSFATSASLDFLGISADAPINSPLSIGTLLITPPSASLVFFATPGQAFAIPIPGATALIGLSLVGQGGSLTTSAPLELTNALVVVIGT